MLGPLAAISNFAVTDRCNGRCTTCNIWRTSPRPDPPLEKVTRFIHDNRATLRHLRFIQLTGGEPFLRDDLPEIAGAFHDALPYCMIWVPTNGLLPGKVAETTERMLLEVDERRLGVTMSLDGVGQTHDAQRGVEGSFRLALSSLKALSKIKGRHPGLSLSAGFTFTAFNHREAPMVQKLSGRYGADFSVRPANLSEHYYRNLGDGARQITVDEVEPILRQLASGIREKKGAIRSLTSLAYLQGMAEYMAGGRSMACSAAEESVFIDASGDVYPCIVMNQRMGNAYEAPLREILTSAEAEEARRTIGRLECPGCWLECEVFRDIQRDRGRLLRAFLWSLSPSS